MAEISINSNRLKVYALKADFKKKFGATLRVYKGKQFAPNNAELVSLSENDCIVGTLVVNTSTTVEEFEKAFKETFGVTVQVATPDNTELSKNTDTLRKAGSAKAADIKLRIEPNLKVSALKSAFNKKFGASLRVYKNIRFAQDNAKISEVRVAKIATPKNGIVKADADMKVADFEKLVLEEYGVKVQVANANNSKLAKNDGTIAEAAKQ